MNMEIEKYSEQLSKYLFIIHEASEGRYDLTGYDICVLEAALEQLQDSQHQTKQLSIALLNWLSDENSIYAILYGNEKRFCNNKKDITTEDVYNEFLKQQDN